MQQTKQSFHLVPLSTRVLVRLAFPLRLYLLLFAHAYYALLALLVILALIATLALFAAAIVSNRRFLSFAA